MSDPRQDPTPIIAASLRYWSGWVDDLDNSPTPAFALKHELILHAVTIGLRLAATRRAAVELALATFVAAYTSGYWPLWQPVYENARAAAWSDLDDLLRVRLLSRLGQCYRLRDQATEATAVHLEAETLAGQFPHDNALACEIAFQLAEDYRRQSEFAQARERALAAWRLVEADETQTVWRATVANTIGLIEWTMGNLAEADGWFTTAVRYWRELSRPVELSRTLSNLGNVLQQQGQHDNALIVYQQALEQLAETSTGIEKLKVQYNTAVLYMNRKQYELAENLLRDAHLSLLNQPGDNFVLKAYVAHGIGNAVLKQGRFGEAEPFLRQAVNSWEKADDRLNLGNAYVTLAKALNGQGEVVAACVHCQLGLAILERMRHTSAGERLYQERREDCQALGCLEG